MSKNKKNKNGPGPHVLHHDLETRSTADLASVGAYRYAADASTEVLVVCYKVDDEPTQRWMPSDPVPSAFVEAANNPNWTIVAHNDQFERPISHYILEPRHGFPLIPLERRHCSMAMTRAAALPAGLEKAVEAIDLPHAKDKAGQALMRRMCRPLPDGSWIEDPQSLERLAAYCAADVEAERALYHALPPLTDAEQALWVVDQRINERGFYTDGALLEAAHKIVTGAMQARLAEFEAITGIDSIHKRDQIIAWLAEHDCELPDLQKGTLSHALRRQGLPAEVRRALEIRKELAHASAAKIETMRDWRHDDGRIRGTLQFNGAATGRWTGYGPQPQNFKRDGENIGAKINAVLAGEELESPVEAVGEIARAMIIAPPGHRLMVGDYTGVESRVLAWIAGEHSKLELWAKFDRTGDPHDDPYFILGRQCGIAETDARKIGKTADLAFGYMGGVPAWRRFAPEDDTSDDAAIKCYRETWRDAHPATKRFWQGLDRAAVTALRRPGTDFQINELGRLLFCFEHPFLRITLPSGRAISYPFARIDGADKFGRPKVTFRDNAGGKFVECRFGQGAWAGLWTENIVQAIARDLLAAALMGLEAAGYPVVLHVHDEIVCEVPDGFGSLEEFKRILEEAPAWAR